MKSFHLLCKRHSSVFRVLSKCGIHFSLKCCKSLSATANWKPSQTANLPFLYSSSLSNILRMSLAFSLLNMKTLLPLLHVWGLYFTSQVLIHLDSPSPEPRHPLSDVIPWLSLASLLVSILVQLSSQGTCWHYFQSVLSPWYLWDFFLLLFFHLASSR